MAPKDTTSQAERLKVARAVLEKRLLRAGEIFETT